MQQNATNCDNRQNFDRLVVRYLQQTVYPDSHHSDNAFQCYKQTEAKLDNSPLRHTASYTYELINLQTRLLQSYATDGKSSTASDMIYGFKTHKSAIDISLTDLERDTSGDARTTDSEYKALIQQFLIINMRLCHDILLSIYLLQYSTIWRVTSVAHQMPQDI